MNFHYSLQLLNVDVYSNQNSIAEEIKSRLRSGNACCHSVKNPFVFQVATQKFEDQDIQNYNFACCFVWVCNLVAEIAEGKEAEGV